MSLATRYDFEFTTVPAESAVVGAFVLKHYVEHNIPLDTVPSAEHWKLVSKKFDEGYRALAIFGWRFIAGGSTVEVTDFYIYPDRWGVLASYAAMERIKADADKSKLPVVTATPPGNTRMIEAYKRFFGVQEPVLLVYKYFPPPIDKEVAA